MSIATNLGQQLDTLDAKWLQAVSFDESIHAWCLAACDVLDSERVGLFLANEDGVTNSSKVDHGRSRNCPNKTPYQPKKIGWICGVEQKAAQYCKCKRCKVFAEYPS